MATDGKIDSTARAIELLSDLRAGCARPDDQHRARRKLLWLRVFAGVNLENIRKSGGQRRRDRPVIGPDCDDDILRLDRAARCLGNKGTRALLPQAADIHPAVDRRVDVIGISLEKSDHIARW